MKINRFLFCLAILVMALASCTTEEQPPTFSYVFKDVSSEAGETSVVISCRNESVDDDKVHASVLLSKNENITDANKYSLKLKDDTLKSTINGLERNTMYYFCFEVYTANEHKRTDEVHHFKTLGGNNVTVTTSEAANITQTGATGGGSVSTEGDHVVTARGVCWDTVHNPNILQNPHLVSGEGNGSFILNITGLQSGTTYYMRAYALSGNVVYYGNEVSFTTLQGQAPTVTTGEVTNITRTTALASGDVTGDGGATVTRRGACWSTSHNPTVEGSHKDSGTGTGSFTAEMTGLTPNTTYYVRAYAENAEALTYGEEVSFKTTEDENSPTVTASVVTDITQTSAKGHGNVTSDGGADVTERGICWSTGHNPTTSGSHSTSGTGTGSFSVTMSSLDAGTTYYVRAYAKNSVGTAYSEEVTFSTTASKPTVTTSEVSNITQTSAKGGGDVTDDGGATVTERGVCWSTSSNPTTSGNHAPGSGTGTGSYIVNITGLTQNTTYYVRAYATNSQGTSYGNQVSLKTSQSVSSPTVTTGTVSNITSTSAKCSGNVTDDGGANVTERGICWSTGHNPTTSGNHTNSGTGTGSYTCSMTGLSPGTIYYVRAYAKNSQGTSYGSEVSFTTTANLPTVTTSQITNIAQSTVTGGGNVTSDGGASVTERGICWSTSHNPTTNGNHTNSGTGTGSFTCNITGLSANTTYYVRAYAKNSQGTAYGTEVSFTTQQGVSQPTVTTSQITNIAQSTATGGGNVSSDGGASVTERGICWSTSHNPTTSSSHVTSGTGTGGFTCNMTGLSANTTYYVRAYAKNSHGTAYGSEVSFTTLSGGSGNAPTGAINGLFSVSATQQVYFSQGNLQYKASTYTWRFATNQYDYVGEDNANISSTYSGWMDLFGWGTSGYNHGASCYQPWSTTQTYSYYYPYGGGTNNLFDQTGQADWGYNAISNGGGQINQWRTLTKAEWEYVFSTRETSSGIRFAKAKVNNVSGVILLPDNWSVSSFSLSNTNNINASFSSNTITASQWNTLEQHGAVFLPAAGYRNGTSIGNAGSYGYYWSSSYYNSFNAYNVYFYDSGLNPQDSNYRYYGQSVRLVYVAQ